jgi:hypothetical protein
LKEERGRKEGTEGRKMGRRKEGRTIKEERPRKKDERRKEEKHVPDVGVGLSVIAIVPVVIAIGLSMGAIIGQRVRIQLVQK